MIYADKHFRWGILILIILTLTTCRKQIIVTEITRADSRKLGEIIADAIHSHPDEFPLVTRECNEDAYVYIDSLYSMAVNGMIDEKYPANNNWDEQRVWRFNIINTNQVMAFCIPGGDFYITKGFLKKMDKDYELFFVMTFEAVLMNEGFLIRKLSEVAGNCTWLIEIANDGINSAAEPTTAFDLAIAMYSEIEYDEYDVKRIDMSTVNSICEQSSFARTGLYTIETPLNGLWFNSRESYAERQTLIESDTFIMPEIFSDCGDSLTTPFQDPCAFKNFINNMVWK